ncbi:M91 family zinc metallopeptidase [Acerihabitans sp. TG2]|uniref:M91 family zinc metallopeptidase n=1 Tax=Acerihabitans sp. TG2 TaxID=3096008 RepID=UPI002B226B8F|nr:M91 family zinc metallopeptidase [Acerihabitans sp. TG2]MEA9393372.1 M91 family zinc metallopeptidase [Acerihabitans sp. TG2]
MANQAGTPVANLNPDYYDQALIYELQTLSGVFSQPVYQRYVLIAGTPVAVRIIVTSNHGVKYEMFQNSHPAMGYALSVNNGQWQVQQELNSPHLSNKLIEVITPEIVDLGLTQARLSAPDDRGLQWTRDQKSYLRIKGNFMRVYQDKHNVNRYRLVTPDGQSALMVHYHKSRFCLPQEMTGQGVEKKAINLKEMNRQRKIINSHLNHAERHLKNGQIIKFFQELYSAYEKHKKFEAGPIRRITTLALDFIDTFIFPKKSILAADDMLVQIEWIRKVALPIQKNESFKENIINKFFRDTPYFYKIISDHILMQPDRDITDKIAKILSNLSITPLPQYAGSRSRYYRMASEGITTVTSINITGNKKFIVDVMRTLDTLSKTVLGYRLIETLKDKEFTIQPPSMSAIEREDDGWFYAKNSAGGAIAFDPANTYIGDASQLEKEPWRQRDPVIGLYHELLHIYYKHHPLTVTSISGKADKKIVGGSAPIEEALITGIDFYDKKTGERYNFSDKKFIQANKGLMMSENNFRREYAIMRGLKYFLIRPYYIKPDAKVTSKNFILSVTQ